MSRPRIFYYCYDSNHAAGGEKHSYQHVDILARHGFDAYALHRTPGFRLTWFENTTPVAYWSDVERDLANAILVLPENLGFDASTLPGRKVIFNKNVYYGFDALGISERGHRVYLSDDVIAVISVSRHNQEYLQFAYPGKPVLVVQPGIRQDVFAYRPLHSKQLVIAYAAKASMEGRSLFQMLQGRAIAGHNRLSGVKWIPVFGLSECQVATLLRDALLLVFLSVHEGLARLPLEAMASGCLVCAYDCGPVSYLPQECRFAYGDLLSVARHIERIVDAFPDDIGQFDELAARSRRAAAHFSVSAQEACVLETWNSILSLAE
jgi:glycosyltransferase involved in cell wall biosynthesis